MLQSEIYPIAADVCRASKRALRIYALKVEFLWNCGYCVRVCATVCMCECMDRKSRSKKKIKLKIKAKQKCSGRWQKWRFGGLPSSTNDDKHTHTHTHTYAVIKTHSCLIRCAYIHIWVRIYRWSLLKPVLVWVCVCTCVYVLVFSHTLLLVFTLISFRKSLCLLHVWLDSRSTSISLSLTRPLLSVRCVWVIKSLGIKQIVSDASSSYALCFFSTSISFRLC